MVDVRMRQNDGIQIRRVVKERFVFAARFGPMALEESAIEQNGKFAAFDQMLTARDFSGRTAECDFHRPSCSSWRL